MDSIERTESLIRLCADSEQLLQPDDLSDMIEKVVRKFERYELSEDEMQLAAGGTSRPETEIKASEFTDELNNL